jgi:hypothetical protein
MTNVSQSSYRVIPLQRDLLEIPEGVTFLNCTRKSGVGLEYSEKKQNLTHWHGLTSARSGRPTAYAFWLYAVLFPVGRRSS